LLGSLGSDDELAVLKGEYARQRAQAKIGPRIAAMLGSLRDYESGITLLFADSRVNFGILTILRTSELGPFTSSEISVLTLALDTVSEQLADLRLEAHARPGLPKPPHDGGDEVEAAEASGAYYVLDRDLQIVLTWTSEEQRRTALTGLKVRLADRLPSVLEETVRELISG
jgi:GAF domain-containing protein